MTSRGFLLPYYYVYSFVGRLSRSSGKDDFREWRAQLVLLWIESQIVLCSLWFVFGNVMKSLGPWIAAIIVVLPLVELNRRLLGNREKHGATCRCLQPGRSPREGLPMQASCC